MVKCSYFFEKEEVLAWFEAAASDVLVDALADGLDLALLAVGAAELEAADLKGDDAVGHLDDVDQTVEGVGGQDEAVALTHAAPPPETNVAGQRVLEGPGQVLVKYRVEVVVVSP